MILPRGRATRGSGTRKRHFNYVCATRRQSGEEACSYERTPNARKIEAEVWEAVEDRVWTPGRLERGLNAFLEAEKEKPGDDPGNEARPFMHMIAEVARKRVAYQDLAADGLIKREELRAKLDALSRQKAAAEEGLETLEERWSKVRELEISREKILACYREMVPEALEEAEGEQRRAVYNTLGVTVLAARTREDPIR